jgi:pSer/pThr/pTyr-binding forkhead associated (FHA) protein
MDDRGFIVPPPGLIPSPVSGQAPHQGQQDATPAVRPLPAFTPPPGPSSPAVPARPVWRLLLPGGRSLPVTRTVLLGRNPSRSAHPADSELIALDDPTSTVSKTHAALAPDGDALTITDLHSTNGTEVDGNRVQPGAPVVVDGAADLVLGDFRIRVERG